MVDPLSPLASAGGIATLCFAIARGLHSVVDDLSRAGIEVRDFADEIEAFAHLFSQVECTVGGLRRSSTEMSDLTSQIKSILDNCHRHLESLNRIQQRLLPLLERFRGSPSKLRQTALRIRWIFFMKARVAYYRKLLHTQHQILHTLVAQVPTQLIQDNGLRRRIRRLISKCFTVMCTTRPRNADSLSQDVTRFARRPSTPRLFTSSVSS